MADHTHASKAEQESNPPSRGAENAAAPSRTAVQLKGMTYEQQMTSLRPADARSEAQSGPVQRRGRGSVGADPHGAAGRGVAGGGGTLPHLESIQSAFGGHDVSNVQAHVGGAARTACGELGAQAYATGNQVAFGSAPDLHTAAHEAAHVVQQRAGVSLSGGLGQSGDAYEQHADRVADAVVAGQSAEGLLGQMTGSSGGAASSAVQRRESATDRGQGEFDRRTPENAGEADGSGAHGVEDPSLTDRANEQFWFQVANAAEAMGMTNAARHMRHYLDNSGGALDIDADTMIRDVAPLRDAIEVEAGRARHQAGQRIGATDGTQTMQFSLTGQRRNEYANRGDSADWYFAVGGFTYWYTADVEYTPEPGGKCLPGETPSWHGQVTVSYKTHIFDRYNWDQGKSVTIAGITVNDEQLGRLHTVGLAQEFEVNGTSSIQTMTFRHDGNAPADSLEQEGDEAGSRDGGRTDPTRDTR